MGLVQKFLQWQKKKFHIKREPMENEAEWSDTDIRRDFINFHDKKQRQDYVGACLERMGEASAKIDELTGEYNVVTAYLQDTEEIEALPREIRVQIDYDAKKIVTAQKDRSHYLDNANRMPDDKFERLKRMEEEVPDGIKKIKKEEDYQVLVKRDLSRLDSEKYGYLYRLDEAENSIANLKGMTGICLGTLVVCVVMLLVMQFGFEMDTTIGYLIVVAAAAITLTVLFVKYSDATKEVATVESCIAKIVTLQNKVKIRYVNNKQLLDYLYLKYGVTKGSELEKLWNQYSEEKKERKKYEKAEEDLVFYKKSLVQNLSKYRIKDPEIWIRQAAALVDPKEMVEIRHELIGRRQALRKQMENNKDIATKAQEEIRDLSNSYPEYTMEIMEMVAVYEEKFK